MGVESHLDYIKNNTCEELLLYNYDEFCVMDESDKAIKEDLKRDLALELESKKKLEEEKQYENVSSILSENDRENSEEIGEKFLVKINNQPNLKFASEEVKEKGFIKGLVDQLNQWTSEQLITSLSMINLKLSFDDIKKLGESIKLNDDVECLKTEDAVSFRNPNSAPSPPIANQINSHISELNNINLFGISLPVIPQKMKLRSPYANFDF